MAKLNNILLVDDDEITNFIDSDLIASLEIAERVSVAENGQEALKYMITACSIATEDVPYKEHIIPELVFLDMNMPEMDGLQLLDEFNTVILNQAIQPPTIIMLSASFVKADIEKVFKISPFVKGCFEKPLTKEILMDVCTQLMDKGK